MYFVFLTLVFLVSLLFIITKTTIVNIRYEKELQIELHFIIFALFLKQKERKKTKKRPPLRFYSSLLKRILFLTKRSDIEIKKLSVPINKEPDHVKAFTLPYLFLGGEALILAYFSSFARKLKARDNSFTLISDKESSPLIDIKLKTELYNLLFCAILLSFDLIKTIVKRRNLNVGN